MKRPILLAALALVVGIAAAPIAIVTPARAQYRPMADRDHDGIPNRYDRRDDRGAWGDKDHDGIPNAFDRRNDRGPWGDKDHDGTPNRFDRNDHNPYRQ